jgi:single-stranded-DNA-specific exonuclease
VPRIAADAEITLEEITPGFYSLLRQMEPFGPGNMRPVFVARNLHHRYEPRIVGTNHLKMRVAGPRASLDAIAFGFGERFDEVKYSQAFSLAFVVEENQWNGAVSLQMRVKGVET